MKKAKEYAQEILKSIEDLSDKNIEAAMVEPIRICFMSLIGEIDEMAKTRNIKTNSAMVAIINEQNQKWKAICRHVHENNALGEKNILREDGFIDLLKKTVPETADLLLQHKLSTIKNR